MLTFVAIIVVCSLHFDVGRDSPEHLVLELLFTDVQQWFYPLVYLSQLLPHWPLSDHGGKRSPITHHQCPNGFP